MIFIYGEVDRGAPPASDLQRQGKRTSLHPTRRQPPRRIGNMPEDMKEKILTQINKWLAE